VPVERETAPILPRRSSVLLFNILAYYTAGDAADGLLNGLSIASLQRWTLVYLGLSALAFIVVWLVGYLRRPG
jgi:Na+(H+)/acetate symporter ActP